MQQSEQVARMQELEAKVASLSSDLESTRKAASRAETAATAEVARARQEVTAKGHEVAAARKHVAELEEELKGTQKELEARMTNATEGGTFSCDVSRLAACRLAAFCRCVLAQPLSTAHRMRSRQPTRSVS